MKVLKVIQKKKDKEGKEKTYSNFYVVCDNGKRIPIMPVYYELKDGTVYSSSRELSIIADIESK